MMQNNFVKAYNFRTAFKYFGQFTLRFSDNFMHKLCTGNRHKLKMTLSSFPEKH